MQQQQQQPARTCTPGRPHHHWDIPSSSLCVCVCVCVCVTAVYIVHTHTHTHSSWRLPACLPATPANQLSLTSNQPPTQTHRHSLRNTNRKSTSSMSSAVFVIVTPRRARLVLGWVTVCMRVGIRLRYVTSQLGQLSLASLRGRLIEYQLRLG